MTLARPAAVALAFECGDNAPPAHGILEALAERRITATFFLDGLWAEDNPELVTAIGAGGHELGNHGHGHPDWTALTDELVLADLARVEAIAQRLAGRTTRPWALPPHGGLDRRVERILASAGYRAVNPLPLDARLHGDGSREAVRGRALAQATDGAVMVVHTGRWATTEAVRDLLDDLPRQGFRVSTVSGLGREPTHPPR